MYRDFLQKYFAELGLKRINDEAGIYLLGFADWLDSHGPTLRSPDGDAIELLRRLKKLLHVVGTVSEADVLPEIDAVLKAAPRR